MDFKLFKKSLIIAQPVWLGWAFGVGACACLPGTLGPRAEGEAGTAHLLLPSPHRWVQNGMNLG